MLRIGDMDLYLRQSKVIIGFLLNQGGVGIVLRRRNQLLAGGAIYKDNELV